MNVTKAEIPDVLIFEPKVLGDERGLFFKSSNQKVFEEAVGRKVEFVQGNHLKSKINILRGMHYQAQNTQGKLIRIIPGPVYDVAVDLREKSKTFGKWVGVELSRNNKRQLRIPEGSAHGFHVLGGNTEFVYKCTDIYNPAHEHTPSRNDPTINMSWPIIQNCKPVTSEKDANGHLFSYKTYF